MVLATRARALATGVVTSLVVTGSVLLVATPAQAACADVDVVFARGTGDIPGLGIMGTPFAASLRSELPGLAVTSYGVNYAADIAQTSARPGSADMVNRIKGVAAYCPNTRFVLGGYSQGATLTDYALGILPGGTVIPAELASRVAAVVVFGNPLGLTGGSIPKNSPTYGARSKDYCADGDLVCGGGLNVIAHFSYFAGPTAEGAKFAADLVRSGSAPVTAPVAPPAPVLAPTMPLPAMPVVNLYERGPAPTEASIQAPTGAFPVSTATVGAGNGFGGGTIYYPTDTAFGTFGAVAISPGFTASQSSVAWLGPRLASQGFVIITIDTNTVFDQPDARGDQLRAALTYLTTSSPVSSRIDPTRLAVMGHSMGGGGTLEAAKDNTALKAAIPLTGWDTNKNFPTVVTPTLVIAAQADTVAPAADHSVPFYNGLTGASEKAYIELAGASHLAPNTANPTIAKYSIAWLKRFVDGDTRYSQFLCPGPGVTAAISVWLNTCPV